MLACRRRYPEVLVVPMAAQTNRWATSGAVGAHLKHTWMFHRCLARSVQRPWYSHAGDGEGQSLHDTCAHRRRT